jgi:hypothetical protein
MEVKKSVLRARLQRALDKLVKEKADYDKLFKTYKANYVKYLAALQKQMRTINTWEEFDKRPRIECAYRPCIRYQWGEAVNRIKRNTAFLEALEGDVLDVESLRTGKNFSLGGIIDTLFEIED